MARPKHLPESVDVRTQVPVEMANAIASLAAAAGLSKSAFTRQVLIAGLQPFALTDPGLAAALEPTTYSRR